ncbi:chemotaxis protein CheA [Mucilaginibacter sp. KACC 22773]|uniref:chemotaxis protein CheA n=1 Tax=Mucilaginibacter sp. KACC 22773 TaxID=3025671 RepID=UPI0023659881|nr:chemotaxis protein CheA [Mucilaginibacter sp. KACC 22773]WDF78571.1 chemotaxis protein CheA [Mucilaginibacter sp. KACC 22773]
MDQYQQNFSDDAMEVIADMEKSLLLMETSPDDPALIQQVFRAMHTLKGNSSMFGFKVITEFTHHLESIYEHVRSGQKKITKEIIDVTLDSLDHLTYLAKNQGELDIQHQKTHDSLTARVVKILKDILAGVNIESNPLGPVAQTAAYENNGLKNYHIIFAPDKEIFYNGTNPVYLLEELQTLGNCTVIPNIDDIPSLQDIEPTYCYTSWDIYLATGVDIDTIREVFVFVEGRCKLEINLMPQPEEAMLQQNESAGYPEEAKDVVPQVSKTAAAEPVKKNVISSIRVPSERLDSLMSLVSELMTLQAKLGTLTDQNPQSELLAVTENLEKISTRLRDNAFSMCLVPIKNMLNPFNRLVRDLANELNKEIDFVTEGTDTELDKNIMEGLADPIMHLLRNSIDHGIEYPDDRVKAGKKRHGQILFKAFCAGVNVYIEIQDDGKGIDPQKIRDKAIQKGIIGKDEVLSEKEIFNLIFLPGFSTAEQVSEISGRGVGMDVVKRRIEDIRGQIKITSQPNTGTTITIKLPITVSIIDGLLVKINDVSFVIPLAAVDRCFEAPAVQQLNRFNNLIILDGEQIPFISLSEEFDGKENLSGSQEIILVYYDEKRVALIVDNIVGKFQAVLKPLGRYFQNMDHISGATILGDGKIALVLDTNKVVEEYLHQKRLAICQ